MTNLILIGPMGAGKTTIGKQLSRRLKRDFFDSDSEIERRTGVDIRTIFEFEGEEGFRSRETAVIDELTSNRNIILATGGGAVLSATNREFFKTRGYVVLLNISVDERLARTRMDKNRPLLQVENPRALLERMREERLPVYRSVADFEINSNNRNMKHVIGKICRFLTDRGEINTESKQQ